MMACERFKKQFVPKEEIAFLREGLKLSPTYFVWAGNNVMRGPLKVQSAKRKRSQAYPEGYEPFVFSCGECKFCIATQKIWVWKLTGWTSYGGVYIGRETPAGIIRPPRVGSEDWVVLNRYADRFDLETYVRYYAGRNKHDFGTVLDLLRVGKNLDIAGSRQERLDLFEFRLSHASDSTLEDLVRLLKLSESPRQQLAA